MKKQAKNKKAVSKVAVKEQVKARGVGRFVFWAPRVLSIMFIAFLALFSLDVFGPGVGFWEAVVGFLIHNIPVFVLIAVLIVAWKHEIVGAAAFFLAGLLYIVAVFNGGFAWYKLVWVLYISGAAFIVGAFFLVNWLKKRRLE
ncbi:hypothetical protein JW826_06125 [Candidatus Woesearchaeota archaeon]|nr:hypothetical protein [Candidatus Woesearchaeota archaeon]